MDKTYIDLEGILDFRNFDYSLWFEHEKNVLQPQLETMGYTEIEWMMGEMDFFGPLTRICKARGAHGDITWFIYG